MSRGREPLHPTVYQRVFEVDALGSQVLEELTHVFVRPAKRAGGIDAVLETFHRDGARSVIEFIVNRINAANGVTPTIEGDDDA